MDGELVKLSRREVDCMQLLIAGKTAKQIADALYISHRTVEKHIENVKIKTGLANIGELIAHYIKSY